MKVAISGLTGFIGKNLALKLVQLGYQIQAIDHNAVIKPTDFDNTDAIIHLAAYGTKLSQLTQPDSRQYLKSLELTQIVTSFAPPSVPVIVAGSVVETMPITSLYAASKAMSTQIARANGKTVLRFTTPYGSFEQPHRLIPQLIIKGLEGKLPILSNPDNVRDFIYVEDVIEALIYSITNSIEPGIYTVGSGKQITLREVVEIARTNIDIQEQPSWGTGESRAWENTVEYIDPVLPGWKPETNFEDGFNKTRAWY